MPKAYRSKLSQGEKLQRPVFDAAVDLLNKKFGMLTVVAENGRDRFQSRLWLCVCDCGGTTTTTTGNLRSGNSRSCGCQKDAALDLGGQRKVCQELLKQRLNQLIFPVSIGAIAATLFGGDRQRAAKWASENMKAGHLKRVGRGVYERGEP